MIGRSYGEDYSDEDSDDKNDDNSSDASGTFDIDEEVIIASYLYIKLLVNASQLYIP